MTNFAVKMARSILELEEENKFLRRRVLELECLEEKYSELLGSSLVHSEKMMFGLLQVGMKLAEKEAP